MRMEHRDLPRFPIEPILENYGMQVPGNARVWSPMKCTLHGQDRKPSAAVNTAAERFICHTCMERSEDAIGLVQWQEGCDYKTAIEICEGITAPLDSAVRRRDPRQRGLSNLLE